MDELDAHMCIGRQVCVSRPHRCHIILEFIEFDGRVIGEDRIVGTVLDVLPGMGSVMWYVMSHHPMDEMRARISGRCMM